MYEYKNLFKVYISEDTSAKDNFETVHGGSVYAAGTGGSITGRGAGIKGVNHFGGAIIIDDSLKPDEASSDTIRESINEWYFNTLQSRTNSPDTPIIFIGQRLHEDDLVARLIETGEWNSLIIPAIDPAGNALHPQMHNIHTLRKMQKESPYVFSAQYQQEPIPAGGGLFQEDWFPVLEDSPKILVTFVTADTAETEKEWNDATVFSFWGLYQFEFRGSVIDDMYGLHWLDCQELRIEPKDLKDAFLDFWASCMRFSVKPKFAAIEKKSTGVTLVSVLKDIQGLRVIDVDRSGVKNNKINRFIEIQQYIASKQVSLPLYAKHTKMCVDHMKKITANDTHKNDDICDTCAQAVKMALIDKVIVSTELPKTDYNQLAQGLSGFSNKIDKLKKSAYKI